MSLTSSELLIVILLSLISAFVTFVVLNALGHHKPFYQIHLDISKQYQTEDKKIAIIDHLHSYIHEYSNEEIIFFNLFLKKKSLQYWFNVLLIILVLITSVMVGLRCIEVFGITIMLFLPVIIYFLPIIWLWKKSNKLGFDRNTVQALADIFSRCVMKIALAYTVFTFIFVSILLILISLLKALLVISTGSLNELSFYVPDILGSYFNSPIGIELGLINSNQFSLAGFYFTFAIGGTVIFSVINSHYKQKMEANKKLLSDVGYYEKWFEKHKEMLDLKSLDIRSFNFDKLNDFYEALSEALYDLRSEFNTSRVIELENPIFRYRTFCFLIVFSYFMGVITIFAKEFLLTMFFYLFVLISLSLIYLSYRIFQDYG